MNKGTPRSFIDSILRNVSIPQKEPVKAIAEDLIDYIAQRACIISLKANTPEVTDALEDLITGLRQEYRAAYEKSDSLSKAKARVEEILNVTLGDKQ